MFETLLEGFAQEEQQAIDSKEEELEKWKENKRRIRELKERGEEYREELNGRFNREKPSFDENYANKETLSYDAIKNESNSGLR